MELGYTNNRELKNFVGGHSLQNKYSIIQFSANVNIKTEQAELTEEMNVSITFDGYQNFGRVSLLESHLDTEVFPTMFDAQWQTFEHVEDVFLKIQGFHKQKPKIGEYVVKIIPIARLKD